MSSSTLDLNAPDAPTIHGTVDNGALSSAPDSPSFDSPSTPSPPRDPIAVNINVSLEYPERESDVRHEPLPMELDKQISTSADLVTSSELQGLSFRFDFHGLSSHLSHIISQTDSPREIQYQ